MFFGNRLNRRILAFFCQTSGTFIDLIIDDLREFCTEIIDFGISKHIVTSRLVGLIEMMSVNNFTGSLPEHHDIGGKEQSLIHTVSDEEYRLTVFLFLCPKI